MNWTVETIESKYGKIPEILDVKKIIQLLGKKENKYPLVSDVYKEVYDWLSDTDISFIERSLERKNLKGGIETIRCFDIISDKKVILIIIDNYQAFNKENMGKDIATNIHKELMNEGYRVIWIKKFEWENTNKQTVMKSLILHALGLTTQRIFARKTVCKVIPNKDLRDFFDKSSFYGYRNAGEFAVCLTDKDTGEVLEAMSFGKPYYGKDKYGDRCFECIRAATKPFISVVGGMSKLIKFYEKNFGQDFDNIVYYIDDAHYYSTTMGIIGFEYSHFSGAGVHNVFPETGAQFMRTPALHKEIKWLKSKGEIYAIPDVGNTVFIYNKQINN
jgi:hypothetical protein